ncbi:hypothetical protein, partial [Mycobacterium intracellulare]|uniref:hypothetical protein n=1 Tax=Mycobacterium intracellulare TaxID=1767 RepID=UPI001C530882
MTSADRLPPIPRPSPTEVQRYLDSWRGGNNEKLDGALRTLFHAMPTNTDVNYPGFSSDPYRRIGSYAPSVFAGVSAACVAVVGHCDGSLGSV